MGVRRTLAGGFRVVINKKAKKWNKIQGESLCHYQINKSPKPNKKIPKISTKKETFFSFPLLSIISINNT